MATSENGTRSVTGQRTSRVSSRDRSRQASLQRRTRRRSAESRGRPAIAPRRSGGWLRRVFGEVGRPLPPPFEVELCEDRADVVLHRLVRKEDLRRDLLVRLALGHECQDLPLLTRQLRELLVLGSGGDPTHTLE